MSPGEITRDFYRAQGAKAERERILELIKENLLNVTSCPCSACQITRELIDLITGEQS